MDESILHEVRADVKELVKQGAVHNELLRQHEQRSTQLENRMIPLEGDYTFRRKAASMLTYLIGTLGSLAAIIETVRYFFKA